MIIRIMKNFKLISMKSLLLFFHLSTPTFIFCQYQSLHLDVNGWTYIINMNDSTKEYTFSSDGNFIETGIIEWEHGTFERTKDKIILKSAKPYEPTTLKKIVLVREYKTRKQKWIFQTTNFSSKENETWQIKSVKNKGFIKYLENQLE
jgi:hypothetical protein